MMQQFSPETKIWVYQADRTFSEQEKQVIDDFLSGFCVQWTAHNRQLLAGYEISHNRFIILKVDETHTNASGCSIDKSVNALKDLSKTLNIGFFNRMLLPYLEGNEVKTIDFNHVEEALEQKKVTADTLFFDLNAKTLAQYNAAFMVPLKAHWAYPKV